MTEPRTEQRIREEIQLVIEIMCANSPGAALNAVVEDYPELWRPISALHALNRFSRGAEAAGSLVIRFKNKDGHTKQWAESNKEVTKSACKTTESG